MAANIENEMEDSETSKRFDTRSKITIRAQADDNDADYTCEARHPALIAPKRASVALNVLCKYILMINFLTTFFFFVWYTKA